MKDSPIELLREKISYLKKLVGKTLIPDYSEASKYAEEYIIKRQEIQELIEKIKSLGVSIDAELVELSEIDGEVKKNIDTLYVLLKKSFLRAKGGEYPKGYWWWHIWDIVEERRKKSLQRIVLSSLIIILVFVSIVLLLNYFKTPSQDIVETIEKSYEYLSKGEIDTAQKIIEDKIRIYKNSPELWLSLGIILENKDKEKAKEAYEKAKILYNSEREFLINRALQYKKLSLYEKAEEDLKKVLSTDKDNSQALYILATIFEEKKQIEDAIKVYRRIEELGDKADPQILVMSKMRLATLLQNLTLPTNQK
ncbi:MAG: hypothetical protein N2Z64_09120 [Dictyoglomus thermophilum]|nr:tetratricopeptide repeat protein [Dictyoglomus thermophilum]MCX7721419.1 hypothetical protein [Dictyoglomus thermophilum]